MNRSVYLRLGLALCVMLGTSAQAPAPSPAPTAMDPHVYQDEAMNFTAPAPVPAELNRLMKISDDVLRQMILIHEKPAAAASDAPSSAQVSALLK